MGIEAFLARFGDDGGTDRGESATNAGSGVHAGVGNTGMASGADSPGIGSNSSASAAMCSVETKASHATPSSDMDRAPGHETGQATGQQPADAAGLGAAAGSEQAHAHAQEPEQDMKLKLDRAQDQRRATAQDHAQEQGQGQGQGQETALPGQVQVQVPVHSISTRAAPSGHDTGASGAKEGDTGACERTEGATHAMPCSAPLPPSDEPDRAGEVSSCTPLSLSGSTPKDIAGDSAQM